MVIFSTNKKNTENIWKKNVCKKMTIEKKMFAKTYMLKKKCLQKIISHLPPPSPLQKNNGPCLSCTRGPTRISGGRNRCAW